MRIKGAEGLSDEQLKAELDLGGRFVVFNWTFSILVMTFRRSSAIYFLRPGERAFGPNFLCSLATIVFGWWGVPWGPVYSLQSLWNNLRGGVDASSAVFNRPPPKASAKPRSLAWPRFSSAPLAAAFVVALIVSALTIWGKAMERSIMPAALVNGLDAAYDVDVNGTKYTLEPRSILQLTLGEDDFSVSASLPGGRGQTRFKFSTTNALTCPFDHKAVIINPDAAAPVVSETTYYSVNENLQTEPPKTVIMSGQQFYIIKKPDYFISEFPESVSIPSESPYVSRTRVYPLNQLLVGYTASILNNSEGRQAMLDYFYALGRLLPNREEVLAAAVEALDPEEIGRFFKPGLAVRPPLLQCHRYYQQYALKHRLVEKDIVAVYRKLAEENPDDGAFAYLYGRILDDPDEAHQWFERALTAKNPCAYANIAIAWDLAGQGEFKPALDALTKARAAGADSESARAFWSECLLALGRFDEAWQDYISNADGNDGFTPNAFTEMKFAFLARGKEAAVKVIDRLINKLPVEFHKAQQGQDSPAGILRQGMERQLAYLDGDSSALAKGVSEESSPSDRFIAAICSGDLAKAEAAMSEMPDAKSYLHLILYLEAARQSDISAYRHWKSSVEAMKKEPGFNAKLAAHLTDGPPMNPQEILAAPMLLTEKRVVLAALGMHDRANRIIFFSGAQKANIDPGFPNHLIEEVTEIM